MSSVTRGSGVTPYTLPDEAKISCFTPWRAARSARRIVASTFTSHDAYGLSSTDGSLAMFAR